MGKDGPARWSASQALAWIICRKPLKLEDREWTPDMGPEIAAARQKLAFAIANEQVHAWGRKQPHGLTEAIPSDPFRISRLTVIVEEYGEMTTLKPHQRYDGPRWHAIEFDPSEIKKAFSKPPSDAAIEWMRLEAERRATGPHVEKRDTLIRDCMAATGCTKRDAEKAHKMLPANLKLTRGKPPKMPG